MKQTTNAIIAALQGLQYAILHEKNVRIEICFSVLAIIAGWLLNISSFHWLIVCLNIGFVLTAELLNTAIEKLCNLKSTEINPAIKIIKDVAAAAVLVAAIISFICGLIIFVPAFLKIINP